jgi:hypothetical protein
VPVQNLRQLREVSQRPGEAVDLVDDDDIDLALSHVLHEFLQRRTLQVASGESTIVIDFLDGYLLFFTQN